ncbi:MAG: 6-bladed beta-propeller [Tannerella sp.]|jgi:hypothetical protein|nr:6-bladed beta-propeller [Tannerella sp.]
MLHVQRKLLPTKKSDNLAKQTVWPSRQLHKTLYCGICLSLVFSCATDRPEDIQTLYINPHHATETVRMSEISSSVRCVPLSTSDETVIGEIGKISVENKYVYVSDPQSLYKFSMEGRLIAKIQRNGAGPEEYLDITDFQTDSDESVWILSRSNKRLHRYDWEGKLLETVSLNEWVSSILLSKDDMYLYVGNELDSLNRSRLKVLDMKTKTVGSEYLPIHPKQAGYLHVRNRQQFSRNGQKTHFFEVFNDTVYALTEQAVTPAYYLNLDGRNIPASFFDRDYRDIMDFFQTLFGESYAYGTSLFMENDRQYVLTYHYDRKRFMGIVYKDKPLTYNFASILEDRLFHEYPISLAELNISASNGQLVMALQPFEIVEYAREHLSGEQVDEIIRKLNYVSEDQNPVILIVDM